MDEREFSRQNNGYSGYTGYGEPGSDAAVRKLEREMVLQEYEEDREAILMTIKDALREYRYDEAQEFVQKYRAAAKTDESFAVLARMTAQGMEALKQIRKIETVLDATPDNDYPVRIACCQKILKIQPNNEKYKAELAKYQTAAGVPVSGRQAMAASTPAQSPASNGSVQAEGDKNNKCPATTGILVFMNFLLCMCFWDKPGAAATVIGLVLGSLLTAFLLNNPKSPMAGMHRALKVLFNVALWFLYAVVIIGVFVG